MLLRKRPNLTAEIVMVLRGAEVGAGVEAEVEAEVVAEDLALGVEARNQGA